VKEDAQFHTNVWSDVATLKLDVTTNCLNCMHWSLEIPDILYSHSQDNESVRTNSVVWST